jgi:excisionase family DNA binding protein
MTNTHEALGLTVAECATHLKISEYSVRRLIKNGSLPAYRITEKLIRVKASDLDLIWQNSAASN